MAARQVWLFLTDEDVRELCSELERREPGLVVSSGRYLKGDPALLVQGPDALERREALPRERRLYLFHRKHSTELVTHEQPAGPFAGWSQIDEDRSDCLVLRLPDQTGQALLPARLYAYVTFWRAADKVRKKPLFSIWASQTLKWVVARYPPTSVKFMRAGPDALAKAKRGELTFTYLYRPIAPEPGAGPQPAAPEGALTGDEPADEPDAG